MFPQMHFEVRPGVILFAAVYELAIEFVLILMCFYMIAQNPFLFEFFVTTCESADSLWFLILTICRRMSGNMIRQVLSIFERFCAARDRARKVPDGEMF